MSLLLLNVFTIIIPATIAFAALLEARRTSQKRYYATVVGFGALATLFVVFLVSEVVTLAEFERQLATPPDSITIGERTLTDDAEIERVTESLRSARWYRGKRSRPGTALRLAWRSHERHARLIYWPADDGTVVRLEDGTQCVCGDLAKVLRGLGIELPGPELDRPQPDPKD